MLGKLFIVEGPSEKTKCLTDDLKNSLMDAKVSHLVINPFEHSLLASLVSNLVFTTEEYEMKLGRDLSSFDAMLSADIQMSFLLNAMLSKVCPALAAGMTVVLDGYIDRLLSDHVTTVVVSQYITNRWKQCVDILKFYPEQVEIIYCGHDDSDIVDEIDKEYFDDYLSLVEQHSASNLTLLSPNSSNTFKKELSDKVCGVVKPPKFKLVTV